MYNSHSSMEDITDSVDPAHCPFQCWCCSLLFRNYSLSKNQSGNIYGI